MKTSNKKNYAPQIKANETPSPAFYPGENILRLILLIFSFALYAYTITFDYALDDTLMITGNKYTQQGIAGTKDIFSHDVFEGFFGEGKNLVAGGRYRPLTHFLFAVEKDLFGFNPMIGHLINILSYALLILLLYEVLKKIIGNQSREKWQRYLPFTIALLFAAHPIHTEVVCNIKGRDEIFSMGLSLATFMLLFRYFEKKNILSLILAFLVFLMALLSKENSITWIGVWILILWFFKKDISIRKKIISIAVLIIPAIFFVILRSRMLGGLINTEIPKELLNNPFIHSSKLDEIATVLLTWVLYFKLLIFPHPLTHDYYPKQIEIISFSSPWAWLGIIITLLTLWIAYKQYPKNPLITFAILLFWGTFSIASNLLFNIGTFMNERFMFVPVLGFCIVLAWMLAKTIKQDQLLKAILITILALYSIKTIDRSTAWKNNFTLFLTDVKTSSNSAKVNVSAAEILLQKADLEPQNQLKYSQEAIQYLNKAEKIYPEYYGVYDLRGKAWFFQKNYTMSFLDYRHCVLMNPEKHTPVNNIFIISQAALRDSANMDAYTSSLFLIKKYPDTLRFNYQMALVFDRIEKWDSCKFYLKRSITLDSNYAPAYNKLGEIYGRIDGDFALSSYNLLKAYQKNPKDYTTLENLGVMYAITQKFDKAMYFFRLAKNVNPKNIQLLINIGHTFNNTGNKDSAQFYYNEATKLKQEKH